MAKIARAIPLDGVTAARTTMTFDTRGFAGACARARTIGRTFSCVGRRRAQRCATMGVLARSGFSETAHVMLALQVWLSGGPSGAPNDAGASRISGAPSGNPESRAQSSRIDALGNNYIGSVLCRALTLGVGASLRATASPCCSLSAHARITATGRWAWAIDSARAQQCHWRTGLRSPPRSSRPHPAPAWRPTAPLAATF